MPYWPDRFTIRQSKTILAASGALERLTKKRAVKSANCFSDKFGQSNCVILRDSCKLPNLHLSL